MAHMLENIGSHRITIRRGELSVSYNFYVDAPALLTLTIASEPDKLSYGVGEEFDATGLRLVGTYNTGITGEITHYTVEGFDSSAESDCCTVKFCCDGCEVSIDVEILPLLYVYTNNGDSITLIMYMGHDRCVRVPSTIEGLPVTTISETCFTHSEVETVILPDTITSIY